MKQLVWIGVVGILALAATPLLGGAVAVAALFGSGAATAGAAPTPVLAPALAPALAAAIPAAMLAIYQAAATICPGLSWTVLAAIGTVESSNGQSNLPGVHRGQNYAGAEGPMQFEPATFDAYDRPVPPGGASPPTPYDPVDAAYAAARLLCANGAGDGRDIAGAVYAYNHSNAYVQQVLQLAGVLAGSGGDQPIGGPVGGATVAVEFALAQVGTPYRWGGEDPGVGFDCSGLVQAAWAAAGVSLPRVAQDQFDAGPLLPDGFGLQPGDLVFFGPAGGGVTHVGMVVDASGQMIDAPHTGAVVRVEPFPLTLGSPWGTDFYLGATRPGGG